MRGKLALVSMLTVVALAGTSGVFAANFTPGSSGLGDPFFPLGGNGGYDVDHYGLTLAYDPPSNQLTGTAVITATATQDLSRFDLDLRGFTITRARRQRHRSDVHTQRPGARHHPRRRPARTASHSRSTVALRGHADGRDRPRPVDRGLGARPTTARSWSASRRARPAGSRATTTRSDKATYDFSVTVPAGLTAMANGVLRVVDDERRRRQDHVGMAREPIRWPPYLATATSASFNLTRSRPVDGMPSYVAVDPQLGQGPGAVEAARHRPLLQLDLRPVPVRRGRARSSTRRKNVGYSLETQTKPCSPTCPTRRRSSTSCRTCGSATRSTLGRVARHLAARGLRDVVGVDLERAPRATRPPRSTSSSSYARPRRSSAFWNPPPGDSSARRRCSTARSTTAAA